MSRGRVERFGREFTCTVCCSRPAIREMKKLAVHFKAYNGQIPGRCPGQRAHQSLWFEILL